MTNIEHLIQLLESDGHQGARAIVERLRDGGALTDYDASKFCARHEVLTIVSRESRSTTMVIEDVAYRYRIGAATLGRVIGVHR